MTKPEPRWFPEDDPPINPGWYAVQRADGSLCLRAYGNGEWWIPLKDGWLSGLPPGFRWMGPVEPVDWDTPRAASHEVKPTGEACPHLRVGTRDGKPWTCRDCGAVRVNGEWSAAPADARLIAAAPELLDALRFIHEHAFEAKWSGDERGLDLVEAAIAKVGGGEGK